MKVSTPVNRFTKLFFLGFTVCFTKPHTHDRGPCSLNSISATELPACHPGSADSSEPPINPSIFAAEVSPSYCKLLTSLSVLAQWGVHLHTRTPAPGPLCGPFRCAVSSADVSVGLLHSGGSLHIRACEPILSCHRSEERRVGKECLRLCRSRWSPYH